VSISAFGALIELVLTNLHSKISPRKKRNIKQKPGVTIKQEPGVTIKQEPGVTIKQETSKVTVPRATHRRAVIKKNSVSATERVVKQEVRTRRTNTKIKQEPEPESAIGIEDGESTEGSGPEDFGDGNDSDFQTDEDDLLIDQPVTVRNTRRVTRSNPNAELLVLSENEEGDTKVRTVKSLKKIKSDYTLSQDQSEDYYNDKDDDEKVPRPVIRKPVPRKKNVPVVPRNPADGPTGEDVLQSIPDAFLPKPDPSKKINFFAIKAARESEPQPPGDIEIPVAKENCLAGLTFVFTGLLPRIPREQAQNLVKHYGGRVTTAPSSKTSCVVIGNEAGPSKIAKIKKMNIKAIDEDGFLQLLREMPANGGSSEAAQKALIKKQEEEEKLTITIKDLGEALKEKYKNNKIGEKSDLWTTKYDPMDLSEICGNKGQIEKLSNWLGDWQKSLKSGFRRAGKDGLGGYRAILISGPPGIGKTTAAHLAAKLNGYDVLENNASDNRSKALLAEHVTGTVSNRSLFGYLKPGEKKVNRFKRHICLIMDEVDGMSSGDRGGLSQMAAMCKTTEVPIILICNDKTSMKMRVFDKVCYDMTFRRPDANTLRTRIMGIAKNEGIDITPSVSDQLVSMTSSDMRQIINLLFSFSRTENNMNFESGQSYGKSTEKSMTLKPFDITARLLSGSTFAENSRISLDEKIKYYFDDYDFTPLMIQENYLNTFPSSVTNGRFASHLDAVVAAADAIADGDLVDKQIRGTQPEWSLMPFHGFMSSIIPSSYVAGQGLGRYNFTAFLGHNSKRNKNIRLLQEFHSHARLSISANHDEVRLQYLPLLMTYKLIDPILAYKEAGFDEVMELMDNYCLTKDDWLVAMDLSVGDKSYATKAKNLSMGIKSAFTRNYNKSSHPVPYMKSAAMFTAKATAATLPAEIPDLVETLGEEREVEEVVGDENDLTKDKYVKEATKSANKRAKKRRRF
jgi:replication factor C subunit 1